MRCVGCSHSPAGVLHSLPKWTGRLTGGRFLRECAVKRGGRIGRGRGAGHRLRIGHADDDPRPRDGGAGPFDPHAFEPVVGRADARRVDEAEQYAVDVHRLLDGVARGARDLRDHGAFLAQQAVQQGRFPDIGGSDDRHGHAPFEGIAQREGVAQGLYFGVDPAHRLPQFGPVGELHVLLGEVQLQFEQRHQLHEPAAQRTERRGVAAPHLGRGQRMGGAGGGGDQIGHRFGLREIHLSGEERPCGEFARPGHAGARGEEQPQDFGDDVGGAVAGEFDRILARIGVRCAENRCEHVVDRAFRCVGACRSVGAGRIVCGAAVRGRGAARSLCKPAAGGFAGTVGVDRRRRCAPCGGRQRFGAVRFVGGVCACRRKGCRAQGVRPGLCRGTGCRRRILAEEASVGAVRPQRFGRRSVRRGRGLHDASVVDRVRGRVPQCGPSAEDAVADGQRLCAAHAQDGDRAAGGGGGRDDGIVFGGEHPNDLRCGFSGRGGACWRS